MTTRDNFPASVKTAIAARVNHRCSRPSCGAATSGPHSEPEKAVNIGVAAHITAASPGGPRYDPKLSQEQRRSADNAIWLCQTCSRLIDTDESQFPVVMLSTWKQESEILAGKTLGRALSKIGLEQDGTLTPHETELLIAAHRHGEIKLLTSDETGPFVRVDGTGSFFDQTDPAHAAVFVEALHSLVSLGLATQDGKIFRLTGRGLRLARELAPASVVIEDMTVDVDFPHDAGIQQSIEKAGYRVGWAMRADLARKTQLEGWEIVEHEIDPGRRVRLLTQEMIFLKKPTC